MSIPKEMQEPNDNPEQEMTMDEILASIRRYVDPHHEETSKTQTVPHVSVGYTDNIHHSANADRIHGYAQTSQDFGTIHQFKDTPKRPTLSEDNSVEKSTLSTPIEHQRSAPLKEFLSASTSHDDQQDVVRLTPQQHQASSSPNPPSAIIQEQKDPEEIDQTVISKEELISQETQSQVRQSFSKLTETLQKKQPEPKMDATSGKITIDDMFRQLAIPMIKSWIDQNMPTMVEKLIEKEIKKITGNE